MNDQKMFKTGKKVVEKNKKMEGKLYADMYAKA